MINRALKNYHAKRSTGYQPLAARGPVWCNATVDL
jgi:hypothetical protein